MKNLIPSLVVTGLLSAPALAVSIDTNVGADADTSASTTAISSDVYGDASLSTTTTTTESDIDGDATSTTTVRTSENDSDDNNNDASGGVMVNVDTDVDKKANTAVRSRATIDTE